MSTKVNAEIIAPELVKYLEELLSQARKGRVVYFAASAGVIDPERPGEMSVLVASVLSGHSQMLDERSLRAGLEVTLEGVAKASQALFEGVNEETDYRKPRILM